jgi:predicted TIM-barrel fold metal-dependent hydrolase
MTDLLLKDFMPRSLLVTEEHMVEKPRFPAVDAHNHHRFWAEEGGTTDVGRLVQMMDECGVKAIADLDGGWGDDLRQTLAMTEEAYPGRFFTLANVDWSRIDESSFGEKMAAQLEESVDMGARGLKIFKALGLRVRDGSGKLLSPDDRRLDPIWAKAGELGIPVLIHVADPVSFFEPLEPTNPSYLTLRRRPEWHFYGPEFPSFEELVEAGIRLMSRHSETTFITAHTGWYTENLKFVSEQMLDELPNMYTDFSARIRFLGIQPYSARRFFITYQDRILFGTDGTPSRQFYRTYFRFLETADENFAASSSRSLSRMCGIDLPDEVLEKIYHLNVEKLIPGLA